LIISVTKTEKVLKHHKLLIEGISQYEVDFVIPYVGADIPLGIDPFLLYKSRDPKFAKLHSQVLDAFNYGVNLVRHKKFREAENHFKYPEVKEIGFGYSKTTKEGAGVGEYLTSLIIQSLNDSPDLLARGIKHIEEMQLISYGIRADRISGILEVETGNEFVPSGKSVWEFGTNKQVKTKADGDYKKRKENLPNDILPAETAFVFVTPRRWSKKDQWTREKQKESFWREVRVYDADDLETWLESAPAIHVWISILLGKHPETAVDLENFWKDWTEVTDPPIISELVISEHIQQVEIIHRWLRQSPSALALQAESKSEAIAFFAAALNELSLDQRERVFSTCLITEDVSAWRLLSASAEPLILISNFEGNDSTMRAVQNRHRVMIPLSKADAKLSSTLEIPRLRRENAYQALINMEIPRERANSLATLARRSFLAFRRKIALNPEIHTPVWSKPSEARSLLPILLVGGFNDAYEKDREAVAKIARISYESVNDTFVRWANEPDPPLRRVGNAWLISSKEDSWLLLTRYLARQDLEIFENVALEILSQIDAQFELPVDERWKAAILVEGIPYSGLLREGIAETLAIMAARSDSITWADAMAGQERVNRIIYELLRRANENWQLWASIAYLLPLLAEAAPKVFLDAVEVGLSEQNPVLLNIFSEGENSLTSSSPHTGLLWALENLAWNPDYLGHSAMLLAKLTRLDPGGKLLNRPNNSLRDIFLCWYPRTTATLDQRLQVIDGIRKREPEVAWQLLNALLPEFHGVAHPTHTPRWREWGSDSEPHVTNAELWRAANEISARLLADVGMDRKKWSILIERIPNLPVEQQNAVIENLSNLNVEEFGLEDRLEIWKTLREIISHHREFPTADWSMPRELTDRLEEIYERLTPEDIVVQNVWLFSSIRTLTNPAPYIKDDDSVRHWEMNRNSIEDLRIEAVNKLFTYGGIITLLKTAAIAEEPGEMGATFGKTELLKINEDEFLRDYLASPEHSTAIFVRGYVIGNFSAKGWEWAKDKLSLENINQWSSAQQADFLICLPFSSQTWDIVETLGKDTKEIYWTKASGYPEASDAERAARELLDHNRPQSTIEFLSFLSRKNELAVPAPLVVDILTKLLSVAGEIQLNWNSLGYRITSLFNLLDKLNEIEESKIAVLEWAYIPILENYGRGPKFLHRELSGNPEFFVEVISYIYKGEDEERIDLTEYDETRAALAHKLINSWRSCPGRNEDGTFNVEAFHDWITKAREKLSERKRSKIGDILIGHRLAFAPYGSDGAFPHEAVRDLIEEFANPKIENGIEIQIFNNRGVVSRAMAEGGGQERAIADRYLNYAKKVGDQHPRTAAMLRRIADNYLSHARREDLSAELEQDLWR
jgi:hypothetical protein